MKIRKPFIAVLTVILLLTACAGAPQTTEDPNSNTSNAAITDTSEPVGSELEEDTEEPEIEQEAPPQQPEKDIEAELDNETVKPWQKAYISILNTVRAQNIGNHLGLDDTSYTEYDAMLYQLYDIDKDGIPELIIEYGNSEASRRVHIYTVRDDIAVQLGSEYDGEMYTGHGSLYTWADGNGIVFYYGHMGGAGLSRWMMADEEITSEGLFEEYVEDYEDYTDIQTIVPGTRSIDWFSIDIDLPVLRYTQVRADWENRLPVKSSTEDDASVRQTLLLVMENNGMIHGAVSDPYASGIGYMAFQDYLGPGMADEYSHYPLSVSRYAWADVNGDGQTECVLHLVRSEEDSYPSDTYAVMSLQGDEVYVYGWSYFEGVVLSDGVFASGTYGDPDTLIYAKRLSFDGEECFQYSVEVPSGVGEAVWEALTE